MTYHSSGDIPAQQLAAADQESAAAGEHLDGLVALTVDQIKTLVEARDLCEQINPAARDALVSVLRRAAIKPDGSR